MLQTVSAMFSGAFAMIAFYCIGMWYANRANLSFILLSCGALVATVQLLHRTGLLQVLIPGLELSALWAIGWGTVFCVTIIWPNYLNARVPGYLNKQLQQIIAVAAGVGLLLVLFAPADIFVGYGHVYRLVMIPYSLYLVTIAISILRGGNKSSRSTILRFLLLILCAVYDLLSYSLGMKPFIDAQSLGFFAFITIEMFSLSSDYTRSLKEKAELSKQLQELNASLEDRINKSTYDLEKSNERLNRLALTDALTELPNRRAFDEVISTEIQKVKRYELGLALVIMDIDHFKVLNDSFGHDCGDAVLHQLGALLRSNCRESDFIARIGGEEFALILTNIDEKSAFHCADTLRKKVSAHSFEYNNQKHDLTVSMGLTTWQEQQTVTKLYKLADLALYKAKELGRNQVAN